MMAVQSYVICATPRSGSTLLCDLLADTEVAGRPASYFRRQSIPNWACHLNVSTNGETQRPDFERAYLEAVRGEGTSGTNVFGLRLMWESVEELSKLLDRLYPGLPDDADRFENAFGPTLYVHLSRQDKVAQAVSRLKATQTGLWHVATDGTERERTMPPQDAAYDADRIADYVAELEAQDEAWTRWFVHNRIEPVRVTYEALSRGPKTALVNVLSALGVDPSIAATIEPRTAKMANSENRDWISRFRAETSASPV